MQRTTINWGIGGALVFPTVVYQLGLNVPSLKPAFLMLVFPPLLVMQTILPGNGEQYGIFIIIFVLLYLAVLGFGLGTYLGSLFSTS
jgi:hypothetical protein